MSYSPKVMKMMMQFQRDEETGYCIYTRIAKREKNAENRTILEKIASEEKEHAGTWGKYTGKEVGAEKFKVFWYCTLSFLMGYTFVLRLMERDEAAAVKAYRVLEASIPEMNSIIEDEQMHEEHLINILDEERLQYVGAIVLGLNDALVELGGTIAGLTFALANTRLVALAGIITGVSATLSMAASNYLAERANKNPNAIKASLYTGTAYLITVVLLILPYLLFPVQMYGAALATMLVCVVLIIFFFNYYIAVARAESVFRRFIEMAIISFGVMVISFLIGLAAKELLNIEL